MAGDGEVCGVLQLDGGGVVLADDVVPRLVLGPDASVHDIAGDDVATCRVEDFDVVSHVVGDGVVPSILVDMDIFLMTLLPTTTVPTAVLSRPM